MFERGLTKLHRIFQDDAYWWCQCHSLLLPLAKLVQLRLGIPCHHLSCSSSRSLLKTHGVYINLIKQQGGKSQVPTWQGKALVNRGPESTWFKVANPRSKIQTGPFGAAKSRLETKPIQNPKSKTQTQNPKSKVQKSQITNPKPKIRNPKPRIRNPKSKIWNPIGGFGILGAPTGNLALIWTLNDARQFGSGRSIPLLPTKFSDIGANVEKMACWCFCRKSAPIFLPCNMEIGPHFWARRVLTILDIDTHSPMSIGFFT